MHRPKPFRDGRSHERSPRILLRCHRRQPARCRGICLYRLYCDPDHSLDVPAPRRSASLSLRTLSCYGTDALRERVVPYREALQRSSAACCRDRGALRKAWWSSFGCRSGALDRVAPGMCRAPWRGGSVHQLSEPHDGSPCCGVRDDRAGAPSHAMRDSVSTGTNEEQAAKLREHLAGGRSKSLYLRAALLVDACRAALLGRGAPQTGTVLPADVFDADAPGYVSDVMAKELDLAARYERFADCAACRLRDSERGSRDGRWRRMKDWAANVWKWPFASIYHYFDAPCPYERGRPLSRGKVQARERRRTCAVVAAFVVLAAWAFFSCTSDQCFTVDRLWASSLSFPAFVLAALVVFLVISEREEVGNRRGECETEEASEPSDETT